MGLASSKYDVLLNGQGYLLVEESYQERAQQSFVPRFSTGDPSTGDLSFWQFLSQEEFLSQGQELFSDRTKYLESCGWDLKKKPRLARTYAQATKAASWPSPDSGQSATLYSDFASGSYGANWDVYQNAQVGAQGGNNMIWGMMGAVGTLTSDSRVMGHQANGYGAWEIENYRAAAVAGVFNYTHFHWYFMMASLSDPIPPSAGSGIYSIKRSGADGITLELFKDDTVIGTATIPALVAGAAAQLIRIERTTAGVFTVYVDGVLKITATDTTYGYSQYTNLLLPNTGGGGVYCACDNIKVPGTASSNPGIASSPVFYNNGIDTCYRTTASAFTITTILNRDTGQNIPRVRHFNASALARMSRDGDISSKNVFLLAVNGTSLKVYNDSTVVATIGLTVYATCILVVNSTTVIVAGCTADNSGIPRFERIIFNAGAWTVASQVVFTADGLTQGSVCTTACLDSSGIAYFAANDVNTSAGSTPGRIFRITSTDLLATLPTITETIPLHDFMPRGLVSIGGVAHYFGSVLENDTSYAALFRYPYTKVYQSNKERDLVGATDAVKLNHGIIAVFISAGRVLMLGESNLQTLAPLLEITSDGAVKEVAAFASRQFSANKINPILVFEFFGKYWQGRPVDDAIDYTVANQFGWGAGDGMQPRDLKLSDMGGNTPLINKTLYSVTIELSEPPSTDHPSERLTIYVNGTSIGSQTNTMGAKKEHVLTSELTASAFQVTLSWASTANWPGYLKRVLLRYVPTQFKKKAWSFMVRATKNLRLIDGTRETSSASTLFSAIKTAWASNTPVTFVDIDGTSHTVLVTDYKRRVPLPDRAGGTEVEQLCAVELLEV